MSVAEQTPAIDRSPVIHRPSFIKVSAEDLPARISAFLGKFTVTFFDFTEPIYRP